MTKQNTTVAKSIDGFIYIDFEGSKYAHSAYVIIDDRGFIRGTYNRKHAGTMTPGMELSSEVKKAINQKWVRQKQCTIHHADYSSIMDAIKGETRSFYNGDLGANGQILG